MNFHILSLKSMLKYVKYAKYDGKCYNCLDFIQLMKYIKPKKLPSSDGNIWIHTISY